MVKSIIIIIRKNKTLFWQPDQIKVTGVIAVLSRRIEVDGCHGTALSSQRVVREQQPPVLSVRTRGQFLKTIPDRVQVAVESY